MEGTFAPLCQVKPPPAQWGLLSMCLLSFKPDTGDRISWRRPPPVPPCPGTIPPHYTPPPRNTSPPTLTTPLHLLGFAFSQLVELLQQCRCGGPGLVLLMLWHKLWHICNTQCRCYGSSTSTQAALDWAVNCPKLCTEM